MFLYSDSEKQQAINLFLGKFIPGDNCLPLWDHPTDYYFHHVSNQVGGYSSQPEKRYSFEICIHMLLRIYSNTFSRRMWSLTRPKNYEPAA